MNKQRVTFQQDIKCPGEGAVVVCKDFSNTFLVKAWHADCREGTSSIRRRPTECVICGKPDVCQLLWEGPREVRESPVWLKAQVTMVPKWFCTDRIIGPCVIGDNTICGACRKRTQNWVVWQYELTTGNCGCKNCADCKLKYNLRGQECKCILNEQGHLSKCDRCELLIKKRWMIITSQKGVWQTRKSDNSLGCFLSDKIMSKWEVNPLALISDREKAFLWDRLFICGEQVPLDSDPFRKGGVLDKTLSRDTDLDLWKEVVKGSLTDGECLVHHKVQGEWQETVLHDLITDVIKDMSFQEEYPIYVPREYSHFVRETSLTIHARRQKTFTGSNTVKVRLGSEKRSVQWQLKVSLTTTSDYMGIGRSIEGVKVTRSVIPKPSTLNIVTHWFRKLLGKE